MIKLHPAAASAIDKRAATLLSAISPHHPPARGDEFPSQREMLTLTQDEMIGEPDFGYVDIAGNFTCRVFDKDGVLYEIAGEGYQDLRAIADQILKDQAWAEALSSKFIETRIFAWCRDRFRNPIGDPLSQHLQTEATAAIRTLSLWFPIANLEIGAPHAIGRVQLMTIGASEINHMRERVLSSAPTDAATHIEDYFAKLRKDLLGGAAAAVTLTAERDHAVTIGTAMVEEALGFLRFYAEGALTPWRVSPIALKGSEYIPLARALIFQNGVFESDVHSTLKQNFATWRIPAQQWPDLDRSGLHHLSEALKVDKPTEFQQRVRRAVLTYSKGATLTDLNDRLVYTFSALEGLLLRNESEPIQQNLGERMAFLIAGTAEDRLKVVRTIKDAYKIRSKYVHHGLGIQEAHALEALTTNAWATLHTAIRNLTHFPTAQAFIDAIEHKKFSA